MSTTTWTRGRPGRGPDAGHAPAPQPEEPAGLGAARDHEVLGAVEGLEVEVDAERGLGEREVQLVEEVVAVALEASWAATSDVDVQVAARAAPGTGRAEAR